ncbi:DUF935 family protein [bacterium]|nr:DUF935 family protein [bacterium]
MNSFPSIPAPGVALEQNIQSYEQLSGYLDSPDKIGISTYRRMVTTDETVAAALEFVSLACLSRLGEYTNKDYPHIQSFIRRNFELMQGSFALSVKSLLEAIWAGFSVLEIVTKVRKGQIWLHSLLPLNQEDVRFKVNTEHGLRHGLIEEVIQHVNQSEEVHIPYNKVIHFASDFIGHEASNPYGRSRLKAIYKNWFLKDRMLQAWGLTLERYGSPLSVVTVQDGSQMVKDENGKEKTEAAHMLDKMQQLRVCSGVVLNEGQRLDIHYSPGGVGKDFEELQTHCNRMIMRGLLLPSLLMDNGDIGSYALGKTHFNLFLLGLDYIVKSVTETILEQLIRPLITFNFGIVDNWGAFQARIIDAEEMSALSGAFANMVNSGVVGLQDREDLNIMRDRLGFDPIEEGRTPSEQEQTTT